MTTNAPTTINMPSTSLEDQEFLQALPPLRRAFTFFPPSERRGLAKRLLSRHAPESPHAELLLAAVAEPQLIAAAQQREQHWLTMANKYRLHNAAKPDGES